MTQAILQLSEIEKAFPGVKALDKASLNVYPGKVMALMGENGAGKSTLMKVLTGIYSKEETHLKSVRKMIETREDSDQILVEVLPLTSFLPSREEHQFRLKKNPKEKCHIPPDLLFKYRSENE